MAGAEIWVRVCLQKVLNNDCRSISLSRVRCNLMGETMKKGADVGWVIMRQTWLQVSDSIEPPLSPSLRQAWTPMPGREWALRLEEVGCIRTVHRSTPKAFAAAVRILTRRQHSGTGRRHVQHGIVPAGAQRADAD
ncbi:hypothetical protein N657DRAFT_387680 [Parathielavia appendiculata]|uniref:Uncharacterized protein n=1 Tax=Parathielavia appendiculata TaxID=2587402 RepID=A0AAN6Z452_9PEZI|nr:hypothetical protein N657DRAFT_387680 [Parathielavia appendiculata]